MSPAFSLLLLNQWQQVDGVMCKPLSRPRPLLQGWGKHAFSFQPHCLELYFLLSREKVKGWVETICGFHAVASTFSLVSALTSWFLGLWGGVNNESRVNLFLYSISWGAVKSDFLNVSELNSTQLCRLHNSLWAKWFLVTASSGIKLWQRELGWHGGRWLVWCPWNLARQFQALLTLPRSLGGSWAEEPPSPPLHCRVLRKKLKTKPSRDDLFFLFSFLSSGNSKMKAFGYSTSQVM